MARFEVFIPGRDDASLNVTLTIEAPNWIGALRSGLKSIGEGQEAIANVVCDIKEDNSIHVTEVSTQRVFRLRDLSTISEQKTETALPAPKFSGPASKTPPVEPVAAKTLIEFPAVPPVASSTPLAPAAPVAAPPSHTPRPAATTPPALSSPPTPRGVPAPAPKRPSGQFSLAPQPASRAESKRTVSDPQIGRVSQPPVDMQDAIAAVFDATQDLYLETKLSGQKIADTLLDIALRHVPAESGTFYLANVNAHDLEFTSVRGPKAAELKRANPTVRVGQGIIGFCAQEGVCLLVNDIQKDPRHYAAIAKTIEYHPRDTLCASAEKDGRLFGAIQLINSKSSGGFGTTEMEILRFIGLTAAAMLERSEGNG